MKRILLFALLLPMLSVALRAQTGLRINTLFEGNLHARSDVQEVQLKGKVLSEYRLSLFRSLTMPEAVAGAAKAEQLVRADAAHAEDKEMVMRGSRLYYGIYQLPPKGKTRRYLFYRNKSLAPPAQRENTVLLIYIEGTATLKEIRRLFN